MLSSGIISFTAYPECEHLQILKQIASLISIAQVVIVQALLVVQTLQRFSITTSAVYKAWQH